MRRRLTITRTAPTAPRSTAITTRRRARSTKPIAKIARRTTRRCRSSDEGQPSFLPPVAVHIESVAQPCLPPSSQHMYPVRHASGGHDDRQYFPNVNDEQKLLVGQAALAQS